MAWSTCWQCCLVRVTCAISTPICPLAAPYSSFNSASPLRLGNTTRGQTRISHPQCTASTPLASSSSAPQDPTPESSIAESVFGHGTFGSLGLCVELVTALESMGISRPTRIQRQAIPAVMGGEDLILGAATGSGKTLAFLLPVVEMLKAEEVLNVGGSPSDPKLGKVGQPKALVILPTRELAEQVLQVAKKLSHYAKFRAVGLIGGPSTMKKQKKRLSSAPVDLVVATTGRLLQLIESNSIEVRYVKRIVIDEVDTMFDAGFGGELQKILRYSRGSGNPNAPQCIAVGATHPKAAELLYKQEFPGACRVEVDLHRAPPGLEQRFVLTTPRDKVAELVALLGEARKDETLRGGRIVVFCNTIDSCRFVEHFLSESGYTTACVHGSIPPDRREAEYVSFKRGEKQLMVCTDVAARGLDNLAIDHVILFDFPNSAVEYIHRAGRTARAGAKGRVTSLILKKDLTLAKAIENAGKSKGDTLESARIAREERARRKRAEAVAREERTEEQGEVTMNDKRKSGAIPGSRRTNRARPLPRGSKPIMQTRGRYGASRPPARKVASTGRGRRR